MIARPARRIAELEELLKEHLEEGNRRLASLGQAVSQAEQDIGGAFDHLHVRAGSLDHADPQSLRHLQEEIVRLRQATLREPLQKVDAALQPVQQWVAQLHSDYGPHIESVRALGEMARKVRRRILLVDDDEFVHKIVSLQLDDNEYELNVARDATEALRQLRSSVPDLVLLDIMMPGIDGLEALRRFRMMPSLARIPLHHADRTQRGTGGCGKSQGRCQRLHRQALRSRHVAGQDRSFSVNRCCLDRQNLTSDANCGCKGWISLSETDDHR